MNIAICDDNQTFANELKRKIEDCCAKKDLPLKQTVYFTPVALLNADLSAAQVLFLDIDMPGMNGLEVAKLLRENYSELIIIFVTAYIEYAPAGYRVNAFRYLLKNHIAEELDCVIEEVQQKLLGDKAAIMIRQRDQENLVTLSNILYFEGTPRRMVLLHLKNTDQLLECSGKLSDYEEQLVDKGFLRLQKSFLVNMMHIKKINNYQALLADGSMLKVSERNYSQICSTYLQWKGQQI